ncbi:MAG TPA: hypothetical protein VFN56_04085 [Candidatus Saccharimonadales bacterium]|nr:hypothetical protein [Candidatus Saccharimonadales bacterium]
MSGGNDKGPLVDDCRYALYGKVCTNGDEQVVVQLLAESPNQLGSNAELSVRASRFEGKRVVLNTPADAIKF